MRLVKRILPLALACVMSLSVLTACAPKPNGVGGTGSGSGSGSVTSSDSSTNGSSDTGSGTTTGGDSNTGDASGDSGNTSDDGNKDTGDDGKDTGTSITVKAGSGNSTFIQNLKASVSGVNYNSEMQSSVTAKANKIKELLEQGYTYGSTEISNAATAGLANNESVFYGDEENLLIENLKRINTSGIYEITDIAYANMTVEKTYDTVTVSHDEVVAIVKYKIKETITPTSGMSNNTVLSIINSKLSSSVIYSNDNENSAKECFSTEYDLLKLYTAGSLSYADFQSKLLALQEKYNTDSTALIEKTIENYVTKDNKKSDSEIAQEIATLIINGVPEGKVAKTVGFVTIDTDETTALFAVVGF